LVASPLDPRFLFPSRSWAAETTGPTPHACAVETWEPLLGEDAPALRASEILTHPPQRAGEPRTASEERVRFEWDGSSLRAQVPWEAGSDAYALGEQLGPLRRNGRRHECWNTDAWCYDESTPALYQSHPWLLVLTPEGRALGVLADTPRRLILSVCDDGVELTCAKEPFRVHLVDGPDPGEVLRALAAMIGTLAPPPHWAFGYHQCRWSYSSDGEVREVAMRMRAERVPCDAIWLDIDYMDRFRVFTWDAERFPDPRGLIEELRVQGLRAVAILDPGVAVAEDYEVCTSGLAGRHFVEDRQKHPIRGRVWPGVCHFPDFTRASTRAWWAGKVRTFLKESGLAGLWNDMNEPALFRTPGGTLPLTARHRGMGGGTHERFHNLYGQLMCEATAAGFRAARGATRPFLLTRANHLSGSRLAATWTGDNQSSWEDLRWSVATVLNLGLSGQPLAGPDLPGFFGDPSEELFVRWFELGAWLPFCRGHSERNSVRKEPWSFGPQALAWVRRALEGRMRLLPTLVTLAREASESGLPICRPLFFAAPGEARLRAVDDAFLLGSDLLVAPVLEPGVERRSVPLPANPGGWFEWSGSGRRFSAATVELPAPLGTCPALARAGAVVVESGLRQHTGQADELRVWNVFLDEAGRAGGRLFEERGERNDEPCLERRIEVSLADDRLRFEVTDSGELPQPEERRRVRVHGLAEDGVLEAQVELGRRFEVRLEPR